MKKVQELDLFCNGIACQLRERCHRYVDGLCIDKHAPGYSWMSSCDEEDRTGYLPMK